MEIQGILHKLRERGHKLTPQRTEILRVLAHAATPLTAQEVYQLLRQPFPNISLDTVYRNLTLLTDAGLANQVNLQVKESTRFEFQGEKHHHHVVCLRCHKSFCVEACPLPAIDVKPAGDAAFQVVGHAFEIYGYCSGCQTGAGAPASQAK